MPLYLVFYFWLLLISAVIFALERLFPLEALADEAQHGHLALGPFDATDAFGGKTEVGDVVAFGHEGADRSGQTRTSPAR